MNRQQTFLDKLGFAFSFCHERIPGRGEDSHCYRLHERGGMIAVFDGCGGSGAEVYPRLGGRSGAYLASRAAATATMQWFERGGLDDELDIDALHDEITSVLGVCEGYASQTHTKIRGSIVRSFPTTLAAFVFRRKGSRFLVSSINAGDSRLYLLNADGLKQLSIDDVSGGDAFTNLYDDPPMTNVVALDGEFDLRVSTCEPDGKFVLLAATDGCFGYFKSPMEFEAMLLETLSDSRCVDDWQHGIELQIDEVAGDDQTLSVLAYGYSGFGDLKRCFFPRLKKLRSWLRDAEEQGRVYEWRRDIWEDYKVGYYSMQEEAGKLQ